MGTLLFLGILDQPRGPGTFSFMKHNTAKQLFECEEIVSIPKEKGSETHHRQEALIANKIPFKIPSRCTDKFLNSPLYKGTQLWNNLDVTIQRSETIDTFMKRTQPNFRRYRDFVAI